MLGRMRCYAEGCQGDSEPCMTVSVTEAACLSDFHTVPTQHWARRFTSAQTCGHGSWKVNMLLVVLGTARFGPARGFAEPTE